MKKGISKSMRKVSHVQPPDDNQAEPGQIAILACFRLAFQRGLELERQEAVTLPEVSVQPNSQPNVTGTENLT